jgi:hypothetical protein
MKFKALISASLGLICLLMTGVAISVECDYGMAIGCPPTDDPQSYINGLDVQLNGGFGENSGECPWATHFTWDWGDGSSNDSYFPAAHTYAASGDYAVTVSAFDGDNWLIDASCDISLGAPPFTCVGFYVPFDVPMMVTKKSKRALPLKFNLFDEYGDEIIDLSPPPIVEVKVLPHTGSSIPGWDGELLPPGLSDDGNEFRYDLESGKWILNLGMKTYTASTTYIISVLAGDSSYAIEGCTESFTRQ